MLTPLRASETSTLIGLALKHADVLSRLKGFKVPDELINAAIEADEHTYPAAENAIIAWAMDAFGLGEDDAVSVLNGNETPPQHA